MMNAKAPYTTLQRAVPIHPTVSELIPTRARRPAAANLRARHRRGSTDPRTGKERHPGVVVRIHEMGPLEQQTALLNHRIDISFIRRPRHEPNLITSSQA